MSSFNPINTLKLMENFQNFNKNWPRSTSAERIKACEDIKRDPNYENTLLLVTNIAKETCNSYSSDVEHQEFYDYYVNDFANYSINFFFSFVDSRNMLFIPNVVVEKVFDYILEFSMLNIINGKLQVLTIIKNLETTQLGIYMNIQAPNPNYYASIYMNQQYDTDPYNCVIYQLNDNFSDMNYAKNILDTMSKRKIFTKFQHLLVTSIDLSIILSISDFLLFNRDILSIIYRNYLARTIISKLLDQNDHPILLPVIRLCWQLAYDRELINEYKNRYTDMLINNLTHRKLNEPKIEIDYLLHTQEFEMQIFQDIIECYLKTSTIDDQTNIIHAFQKLFSIGYQFDFNFMQYLLDKDRVLDFLINNNIVFNSDKINKLVSQEKYSNKLTFVIAKLFKIHYDSFSDPESAIKKMILSESDAIYDILEVPAIKQHLENVIIRILNDRINFNIIEIICNTIQKTSISSKNVRCMLFHVISEQLDSVDILFFLNKYKFIIVDDLEILLAFVPSCKMLYDTIDEMKLEDDDSINVLLNHDDYSSCFTDFLLKQSNIFLFLKGINMAYPMIDDQQIFHFQEILQNTENAYLKLAEIIDNGSCSNIINILHRIKLNNTKPKDIPIRLNTIPLFYYNSNKIDVSFTQDDLNTYSIERIAVYLDAYKSNNKFKIPKFDERNIDSQILPIVLTIFIRKGNNFSQIDYEHFYLVGCQANFYDLCKEVSTSIDGSLEYSADFLLSAFFTKSEPINNLSFKTFKNPQNMVKLIEKCDASQIEQLVSYSPSQFTFDSKKIFELASLKSNQYQTLLVLIKTMQFSNDLTNVFDIVFAPSFPPFYRTEELVSSIIQRFESHPNKLKTYLESFDFKNTPNHDITNEFVRVLGKVPLFVRDSMDHSTYKYSFQLAAQLFDVYISNKGDEPVHSLIDFINDLPIISQKRMIIELTSANNNIAVSTSLALTSNQESTNIYQLIDQFMIDYKIISNPDLLILQLDIDHPIEIFEKLDLSNFSNQFCQYNLLATIDQNKSVTFPTKTFELEKIEYVFYVKEDIEKIDKYSLWKEMDSGFQSRLACDDKSYSMSRALKSSLISWVDFEDNDILYELVVLILNKYQISEPFHFFSNNKNFSLYMFERHYSNINMNIVIQELTDLLRIHPNPKSLINTNLNYDKYFFLIRNITLSFKEIYKYLELMLPILPEYDPHFTEFLNKAIQLDDFSVEYVTKLWKLHKYFKIGILSMNDENFVDYIVPISIEDLDLSFKFSTNHYSFLLGSKSLLYNHLVYMIGNFTQTDDFATIISKVQPFERLYKNNTWMMNIHSTNKNVQLETIKLIERVFPEKMTVSDNVLEIIVGHIGIAKSKMHISVIEKLTKIFLSRFTPEITPIDTLIEICCIDRYNVLYQDAPLYRLMLFLPATIEYAKSLILKYGKYVNPCSSYYMDIVIAMYSKVSMVNTLDDEIVFLATYSLKILSSKAHILPCEVITTLFDVIFGVVNAETPLHYINYLKNFSQISAIYSEYAHNLLKSNEFIQDATSLITFQEPLQFYQSLRKYNRPDCNELLLPYLQFVQIYLNEAIMKGRISKNEKSLHRICEKNIEAIGGYIALFESFAPEIKIILFDLFEKISYSSNSVLQSIFIMLFNINVPLFELKTAITEEIAAYSHFICEIFRQSFENRYIIEATNSNNANCIFQILRTHSYHIFQYSQEFAPLVPIIHLTISLFKHSSYSYYTKFLENDFTTKIISLAKSSEDVHLIITLYTYFHTTCKNNDMIVRDINMFGNLLIAGSEFLKDLIYFINQLVEQCTNFDNLSEDFIGKLIDIIDVDINCKDIALDLVNRLCQ